MNKERYSHNLMQKLFSEFVGTFLLTFASAGTGILRQADASPVNLLSHIVAPALAVLCMIYAFGNVSGAHLNPIISVAFRLRKVFPSGLLIPYILAQTAGSIVAAIFLLQIYGHLEGATNAVKAPLESAVSMEIALSFSLTIVVIATATRHRILGADAAIPVAAIILLCGFLGDSVSSACMNPARALGPALVSGNIKDLCLFIVMPFIGMPIAVVVNALIHWNHHPDEQTAAEGE